MRWLTKHISSNAHASATRLVAAALFIPTLPPAARSRVFLQAR